MCPSSLHWMLAASRAKHLTRWETAHQLLCIFFPNLPLLPLPQCFWPVPSSHTQTNTAKEKQSDMISVKLGEAFCCYCLKPLVPPPSWGEDHCRSIQSWCECSPLSGEEVFHSWWRWSPVIPGLQDLIFVVHNGSLNVSKSCWFILYWFLLLFAIHMCVCVYYVFFLHLFTHSFISSVSQPCPLSSSWD